MEITDNIRTKNLHPLIAPDLLLSELPITSQASDTVGNARQQITKIIQGKDDRLVIVVGPCSIHDPQAALDYAKRLKPIAEQLSNELCIIMRVYFEKPRTTIGWKGLINDPRLDGSFDINRGLRIARHLLLDINQLGMPTASEFLDTTIPQYIADLTAWAAIGARTVESQIHRELASGLSMPVGFKNGTGGSIQIAIDAICAASQPHHFLGISKQGVAAIVSTTGNEDCHIILRGSKQGINYDRQSIATTVSKLAENHLIPRVMVDCSHGNSNNDYTRQELVVNDLIEQMLTGNVAIFGLMIESNLIAGKQSLTPEQNLTYGQSITDGCIGWENTIDILKNLADTIKKLRNSGSR